MALGDFSPSLPPRAGGPAPRGDTRWRDAVIVALALGTAVIVGLNAGAGRGALVMAALVAAAAGLVIVERPAFGATLLVAPVPAVAGLKRGLPVPGFRISELLVVGISGAILLTRTRKAVVPWRTFDWLLLLYAAATFGLGAYGLSSRNVPIRGENLGTMLGAL